MNRLVLSIAAIIAIFSFGCNEQCEDCANPFIPSEPFVNLNFFRASNDSLVAVTIETFNGADASGISFFVSKSSSFQLPLSMNEDSSIIVMRYTPSDPSDSLIETYTDSLLLRYTRELNARSDGKIGVNIEDVVLVEHSFVKAFVSCKENVPNCLSSEANLNVSF